MEGTASAFSVLMLLGGFFPRTWRRRWCLCITWCSWSVGRKWLEHTTALSALKLESLSQSTIHFCLSVWSFGNRKNLIRPLVFCFVLEQQRTAQLLGIFARGPSDASRSRRGERAYQPRVKARLPRWACACNRPEAHRRQSHVIWDARMEDRICLGRAWTFQQISTPCSTTNHKPPNDVTQWITVVVF